MSADESYTDELSTTTTAPSAAELDACGDDEGLKFLLVSFPGQSLTHLKFVLGKCDNDVARSVDELLNHELIDEERRILAAVDGGDLAMGKADDLFNDSYARRKARRRREKHQAKALPAELTSKTPAGSVWDKMSTEVEWAVKTLHLPRGVVQSAFHRHNSALAAALDDLLDSQSFPDDLESGDEATEDDETTISIKRAQRASDRALLFKTHHGLGAAKLDIILRATKGDMASAKQVAGILSTYQPAIQSLTSAMSRSTVSGGSGSVARDAASLLNGPALDRDPEGLSAAECLAKVVYYQSKRDESFRQAAQAHGRSKSDRQHAGVALHYADAGRAFDAQMRAWKMRHARQLARERSINSTAGGASAGYDGSDPGLRRVEVDQGRYVDLHGLTVHEALVIAREAVTRWYAAERLIEPSFANSHNGGGTGGALNATRPFRIVTGVGRHSSKGEARILPAVTKMLDRDGYRYDVTAGEVAVKGVVRA